MSKSLKERIKEFFSPKGSAWFLSPGLTGGGEKQVIMDLDRYAKTTSVSIKQIGNALQAYTSSNAISFHTHIDNMVQDWMKAEKIRESLINAIATKRLFFPESRENMLELINSMNSALMITTDLRLLSFPEERNDVINLSIKRITDQILELVDLIPSTVKYLNEDPKHSVVISRRSIEIELEFSKLLKQTKNEIEKLPKKERALFLDLVRHLSAIFRAHINVINQVQELAIKFV